MAFSGSERQLLTHRNKPCYSFLSLTQQLRKPVRGSMIVHKLVRLVLKNSFPTNTLNKKTPAFSGTDDCLCESHPVSPIATLALTSTDGHLLKSLFWAQVAQWRYDHQKDGKDPKAYHRVADQDLGAQFTKGLTHFLRSSSFQQKVLSLSLWGCGFFA